MSRADWTPGAPEPGPDPEADAGTLNRTDEPETVAEPGDDAPEGQADAPARPKRARSGLPKLRPETRVGLAAVLSFGILVTALLLNRGRGPSESDPKGKDREPERAPTLALPTRPAEPDSPDEQPNPAVERVALADGLSRPRPDVDDLASPPPPAASDLLAGSPPPPVDDHDDLPDLPGAMPEASGELLADATPPAPLGEEHPPVTPVVASDPPVPEEVPAPADDPALAAGMPALPAFAAGLADAPPAPASIGQPPEPGPQEAELPRADEPAPAVSDAVPDPEEPAPAFEPEPSPTPSLTFEPPSAEAGSSVGMPVAPEPSATLPAAPEPSAILPAPSAPPGPSAEPPLPTPVPGGPPDLDEGPEIEPAGVPEPGPAELDPAELAPSRSAPEPSPEVVPAAGPPPAPRPAPAASLPNLSSPPATLDPPQVPNVAQAPIPADLDGAGWVPVPNANRRPIGLDGNKPEPASGPAPALAEADDYDVPAAMHVVRSGENFWTISRKYYASGRYYRALWAANKDKAAAPDQLYVGTTIVVPPAHRLDPALVIPPARSPMPTSAPPRLASAERELPSDPAPAPVPAARPATRPVSATTPAPAPRGEVELSLPVRSSRFSNPEDLAPIEFDPEPASKARSDLRPYTVRPNETVRSIARDILGNSRRADEILELNRDVIQDETRLAHGTVLHLPEGGRPRRRPDR